MSLRLQGPRLGLKPRLRTLAVVVPVLLGLSLALGEIINLDERWFLGSVQRFRAVSEGPLPIHSDLAVAIVDDSSLAAIGRYPKLVDLIETLSQLPFEKVLISGLTYEHFVDVPVTVPATGSQEVWLGAVLLPSGSRAGRPADVLEAGLFKGEAIESAGRILAPQANGAGFAGIGLLNSKGEYAVPTSLQAGPGKIDHLTLALAGPNPSATMSDTLYVEYVSQQAVTERAVPFPTLSAIGADLAKDRPYLLVVPDGYTGGRFVTSPFGVVPTYVSMVSLASGSLYGRFLQGTAHYSVIVLGFAALLMLMELVVRSRKALLQLLAGMIVLPLLLGYLKYRFGGVLVPAASCAMIAFFAFAGAGAEAFLEATRVRAIQTVELDAGRIVQTLLVAKERQLNFMEYDIAIKLAPAGPLSGDWFHIYETAEELVICFGDVTGKGVAAALTTASIAALWQAETETWRGQSTDLAGMVQRLDRRLFDLYREELTTTLTAVRLSDQGAEAMVCGAAPWCWLNQAYERQRLPMRSLGLVGQNVYARTPPISSVRIGPGDLLIATSDGLVDGSREFERLLLDLRSSLASTVDAGAHDILKALFAVSRPTLVDDAIGAVIKRGNR